MTALITPADRIFVAGHRGMAGSAICRALQRAGYTNLLTASRAELDLEDGPAVQRWFADHQPSVVVLAAAKVGGIQANNSHPADFLLQGNAGQPLSECHFSLAQPAARTRVDSAPRNNPCLPCCSASAKHRLNTDRRCSAGSKALQI